MHQLTFLSPNFRATKVVGRLTLRFDGHQANAQGDSLENWVLNLEHSDPEAETLPT
ncbi:hypothetical protein AVEN_236741-1, partial [Araneus ventricosus]